MKISSNEKNALNSSDRALREAVLRDGKQDLLGAYRRLSSECIGLGQHCSADLDNLRQVQAMMALAIYAALKATPVEEMTPEMRDMASEIQRCGLSNFVRRVSSTEWRE